MERRRFLKVLGGSAAGLAAASFTRLHHALASQLSNEYFLFIHAQGGWDVTLWSDPRNAVQGLVDPASTDNTDISKLTKWTTLTDGSNSFELLAPTGSSPFVFGPGIGNMIDLYQRITLVNGLAMSTVSHPDGI